MSNSEASASELLENIEEIFPRYYMESDILNRFKSSTTHPSRSVDIELFQIYEILYDLTSKSAENNSFSSEALDKRKVNILTLYAKLHIFSVSLG